MKHILAIFAAVVISISSFCQDQSDYMSKKNEFNLGYFNAFELNSRNNLAIGYKRLTDKGAFRFGTGFYFRSTGSDIESIEDTESEYQISPKLGYEYHKWFNRFRLQYGSDIIYSYYRSESEYIPENPINNYSHTATSHTFGIRPTLGLTFFINKSISISTETYMYISYNKRTSEHKDYNDTESKTYTSSGVGLGPLGLFSINFHF